MGSICRVYLHVNLCLHMATRFFETEGQLKLGSPDVYLALVSTCVPFIVAYWRLIVQQCISILISALILDSVFLYITERHLEARWVSTRDTPS